MLQGLLLHEEGHDHLTRSARREGPFDKYVVSSIEVDRHEVKHHRFLSRDAGALVIPTPAHAIVGHIIYTYIRMTHYKLFSAIFLTYKVSTSPINYQLSHHPTIDKSLLHHTT
jgi:hypothetical protein